MMNLFAGLWWEKVFRSLRFFYFGVFVSPAGCSRNALYYYFICLVAGCTFTMYTWCDVQTKYTRTQTILLHSNRVVWDRKPIYELCATPMRLPSHEKHQVCNVIHVFLLLLLLFSSVDGNACLRARLKHSWTTAFPPHHVTIRFEWIAYSFWVSIIISQNSKIRNGKLFFFAPLNQNIKNDLNNV